MEQLLRNLDALIIILGVLLTLIAVIRNIKTKWGEINLETYQSIIIGVVGLFFLSFSFFQSLNLSISETSELNENILLKDGNFRWDWTGLEWEG